MQQGKAAACYGLILCAAAQTGSWVVTEGSRDVGLTPPLGCRPFLRMTTVPFPALSTFPTRHSPPRLTWWWDTSVTVLETQWGRLRKLGSPEREPQWPSLPHCPAFSKVVAPGTWDKCGPNPRQSKGSPGPGWHHQVDAAGHVLWAQWAGKLGPVEATGPGFSVTRS